MPCLSHRLRHGAMKGYPAVLDGDKVDTKEETKIVAYLYELRIYDASLWRIYI